ncbi:MAG: SurA N-terminal domain-containing protein, partial [Pseudomonadota bacterium]
MSDNKKAKGSPTANPSIDTEEETIDVTPVEKKPLKAYIGKAIFIVLMIGGVAGFILGDMQQYLGGASPSILATVGDTDIAKEDAETMRNNIMQQYRDLPPEIAQMQRPAHRAIELLIEQNILSEYGRMLGLRAPDQRIKQLIETIPYFKDDVTGEFSAKKFREVIKKRFRISENDFIRTIENDIIREMIFKNMSSDVYIPDDLLKIHADYNMEKRNIDYIVFDENSLGQLPAFNMSLEEQKDYFAKHKNLSAFRRPELRDVAFLTFTP